MILKHLGVQASEAMMVGDMPSDIEMGKRAHVAMTIGVTHGFGTRESLAAAGANLIIDDIPSLQALPSLTQVIQ